MAPSKRMTVPDFTARKGGAPLVCLTAYDMPMTLAFDPFVDMLLVGDSLGMVVYGFESTLPVTLEMMILHGRTVAKFAKKAIVVVDMPYQSYQGDREKALESCMRVMAETGCGGVKLEGGEVLAETIDYLTKWDIPVMGHIGLRPQAVHALGGYGVRGGDNREHDALMQDARAIEKAGAFALVLEKVYEELAQEITQTVKIPVIGIGCGPTCDGQILVGNDIINFSGRKVPGFVKTFANVGAEVARAAEEFAQAVRSGEFPGKQHSYRKPEL